MNKDSNIIMFVLGLVTGWFIILLAGIACQLIKI